ncbi:MAG: hypothetical protein LUQ44_03370, partial [Methanothrix sp.]|nr:hypothetical protein [Methanothrix sp.]
PMMAEILPMMAVILPMMAEILPMMAEILPMMAEILPMMAEILLMRAFPFKETGMGIKEIIRGGPGLNSKPGQNLSRDD